MTFLDIFSKKIEKNTKIKIIVDNREKQSLVVAKLISLGALIEFKQLDIGDYITKEIVIERKTLADLQSSIINKRIFSQLENLKQYPKPILIVEGESDLFIHENALRGFLLSVVLDYKIPTIFSKNEEDTAKYLISLSKKSKNKEISLRRSISFKSKLEQKQYILEGFPGIGPKTSKKLLKKFGNLKNIINANTLDLAEILGKKTDLFLYLITK